MALTDENSVKLSAIFSAALVLRQKNHRVSVAELKQHFAHVELNQKVEFIRCLKDIGIKSKWTKVSPTSLASLPLPVIIQLNSGDYAVLNQVNADHVLVHELGAARSTQVEIYTLFDAFDGEVMLLMSDKSPQSTVSKELGFAWFFQTLFKYKSIMREAILASFFLQLFALVTPLFFMIIIDKVFSHNNLATLDVLVFAMIVVTLFDIVLGGVRTYLMSHTSNRADLELGSRLFRHMLKLPLSYFESRRSGETIARMRELETIRQFFTGSTLTLFVDLLFLVVFLAVMCLFSQTLFLIVLCSLPLFFVVSYFITPLMRSKTEDKHQKMAENQSFLVESIGGIETIKSAAVEGHYQREYENRLADLSHSAFHGSSLANLINQFTNLISKLLTIVLLYVGAKLVLSGALSVGQLIAFNMLTARVVQPIQRLAQIWQEFTSVKVSFARLADILKAPVEPVLLTGKTNSPINSGRIELSNLSFAYAQELPNALENINLVIQPCEVVGVVGSTGSGKTTIAKLMQRLYVPTKGKVLIDGQNLVSVDGAVLRSKIGVVAQDFVLFNQSIRDNITLGETGLDDQIIFDTASRVGVHNMILDLQDGYDTMLQERGRGLSTGQRQAIALVRALVTNPAILILDEATSAMDYEAEQRFQANFSAISANRTTIVIAHRLSTVRHANRIITLEGGRIVENDSPDALLKSGGRFASLYHIHQSMWAAPRKDGMADA